MSTNCRLHINIFVDILLFFEFLGFKRREFQEVNLCEARWKSSELIVSCNITSETVNDHGPRKHEFFCVIKLSWY